MDLCCGVELGHFVWDWLKSFRAPLVEIQKKANRAFLMSWSKPHPLPLGQSLLLYPVRFTFHALIQFATFFVSAIRLTLYA